MDHVETFSTETDYNNIPWEYFTAVQQAQEIEQTWPRTKYHPQP